MDIADQLEIHAKQALDHALIISRQIDYLGKMPALLPSRYARRKIQRKCRIVNSMGACIAGTIYEASADSAPG